MVQPLSHSALGEEIFFPPSNRQMWNEVLAFLPRMGLGVAKILAVACVRYQLSPPQTHPSTQSSNVPLLLSLPVPRPVPRPWAARTQRG